MIFYFSGTGNSQHVAEVLSERTGERMILMSEASLSRKETYVLQPGERLGFVFPVYWYTLPTLVDRFIRSMALTADGNTYAYAVATYGMAAGHVMKDLARTLAARNLTLNGRFGVRMVDNYIVAYAAPSDEKQRVITLAAESDIQSIAGKVDQRENGESLRKGPLAFVTPLTGCAYRRKDHTKKFHATVACNGCGLCAGQCPCGALRMDQGRPVWEGPCTFCLKCLHSCPSEAVQYGRSTVKRKRYRYKQP